MTRYNTLFFHMEWSLTTLTTHISDYKNHRIFDNTFLKDFIIYQTSWIAFGYFLLTLSQWERVLLLQKLVIAFQ